MCIRDSAKGIALFGDMPIYVAEDSADTWAEPELFQLDKKDFTPDVYKRQTPRWRWRASF